MKIEKIAEDHFSVSIGAVNVVKNHHLFRAISQGIKAIKNSEKGRKLTVFIEDRRILIDSSASIPECSETGIEINIVFNNCDIEEFELRRVKGIHSLSIECCCVITNSKIIDQYATAIIISHCVIDSLNIERSTIYKAIISSNKIKKLSIIESDFNDCSITYNNIDDSYVSDFTGFSGGMRGNTSIELANLVDERGYTPIFSRIDGDWFISSGCRCLPLDKALIHWTNTDKSESKSKETKETKDRVIKKERLNSRMAKRYVNAIREKIEEIANEKQ